MLKTRVYTIKMAILLISFNLLHSQPNSSKQQTIQEVISSIELPLNHKIFKAMLLQRKNNIPDIYLNKIGLDLKLDSSWRPNNLFYDKAKSIFVQRLEQVVTLDKSFLEPDFAGISELLATKLTDEDIKLLKKALITELGQAYVKQNDAMTVVSLDRILTNSITDPEISKMVKQIIADAVNDFSMQVDIRQKLERKDPVLTKSINRFIKNHITASNIITLGRMIIKNFDEKIFIELGPIMNEVESIARNYKNEGNYRESIQK